MPAGTIPLVPFTGVVENAVPLQLTAVIALTDATGFTVTVNTNVAFAPQLTDVGVTVYVALCAVLVGLVKVPKMFDPPPVPDKPPVSPPVTIGTDQLYVVPAGTTPLVPLTGVVVNSIPLHVVADIELIVAFGLTVTVNWKVAPVQLPVNGVTV